MAKQKKTKVIIGWREFIAIPAMGIKEVKAKVDTGARTSSLHISHLKIIKRSETEFAEFIVHPKQHSKTPEIKNRCRIYGFRLVKSSNGVVTRRPVVKVKIILGTCSKEIELTLVNRDLMGFRMLLGRTALKPDFIVDPGRSYLISKREKQRKNV